jgi:formiminotetrahydrofolate cyclodeaminase
MADRPLTDLTVAEFLTKLASGDPTPGGGAVAALAGALGAALVSMVCNLTVGRERYAATDAETRAILANATALLESLQAGVQRDASAYDTLMAAFRLPRGDDQEKAARTEAIQTATVGATIVPLELAEASAQVIDLAEQAIGKTNPNAASDLAVAALLGAAAVESAAANVEINLKTLKDEAVSSAVSARLQAARGERDAQARRVVERTQA